MLFTNEIVLVDESPSEVNYKFAIVIFSLSILASGSGQKKSMD